MSDNRDWYAIVIALLDLTTALVRHYTDHPAKPTTEDLIAKQMQAMDIIVQQIEVLQAQGKRELAEAEQRGRENAEFVETTIIPPDEE